MKTIIIKKKFYNIILPCEGTTKCIEGILYNKLIAEAKAKNIEININ